MPSMIINGKKVKLKLVKEPDQISVRAVSIDGAGEDSGWLITFNSDGTFTRIGRVTPSSGLDLNKSGQIKEKK